MSTGHIVRITLGTGSPRKKPCAGDEKVVRGVVLIRQQVRHGSAWVVSRGRPVWEWVEKGGDRDRARNQPRRQPGQSQQDRQYP